MYKSTYEEQIEHISKLSFVLKTKKCYQTSTHLCSVKNKEDDRLIERQISHMRGNSFKKNGFSGKGIRVCVIDGGFKGAKGFSCFTTSFF